jgi:hypothetical protein
MKSRQQSARTARRAGGKRDLSKIGRRVLFVLMISALMLGALAISLTQKREETEQNRSLRTPIANSHLAE